jgi:SAM-dependent methyltransferase
LPDVIGKRSGADPRAITFEIPQTAPFALEREEVVAALEPYAERWTSKSDPAWLSVVKHQMRTARRQLAKRRMLGWWPRARRDQGVIEAAYDRQWRKKSFERYAIGARPRSGGPWEWGDEALFLTNEGGSRVRLLYLMRAIAHLQPRSVLEVGCGNGVNLFPLACRFPEIAFSGLDFTEGGMAAARVGCEEPTLPHAFESFSPEPIVDRSAHRRINFVRGSGGSLPFRDASFDLVFTALALEQMERIRDDALYELARVTRRLVVMLEPFAEFNAGGLPRTYIAAYDYFRGRIADLPSFGLRPFIVTGDMPAKVTLKPVLVVAEKIECPTR